MKGDRLVIVPSERHVERLALEGVRAETRTRLFERLAAALLPDLVLVDPIEVRLVLAATLGADETAPTTAAPQLDLFGAPSPAKPKKEKEKERAPYASGDLLATVRALGGVAWTRTVFAIDDAIAVLRATGIAPGRLDPLPRAAPSVAARAAMLARTITRLDATLGERGLTDARQVPALLAKAIAKAAPPAIRAAIGATSIETRFVLGWEGVELEVFRALDAKVGATIVLPQFERELDPLRERDPLERLSDGVARGLDGAPAFESIALRLGDLGSATPSDPSDVTLVRAASTEAQAKAAVRHVLRALEAGAPVERVAVATTLADERSLGPLRLAFEEEGVVAFESRGAPPSQTPLVAAVVLALALVDDPDRRAVARVLRSGYVDPARLLPLLSPRDAELACLGAARALESNATAAGPDAWARLEATVRSARRGRDENATALVRALVRVIVSTRAARTRRERLAATRTLLADLGVAARAGRGSLDVFATDESPHGVSRLARLALARDARAFEALGSALELCERAWSRAGALDDGVTGEVFRLELTEALDRRAARPFGGSAAAVRIARIEEIAGEPLDLLVVLDANDGALPRDAGEDAIASDALLEALDVDVSRHHARDLAALALAAHHTRALVFVHVREDAAGAPIAPSFVVESLERAGATSEVATTTARTFADMSTSLRAAREREREGFFLDPARPRTPVVGDVSSTLPEEARGLLATETGGGERPLAVTGLERFARCVFQGLAHVVFAAREAETPEDLPDAREEGILIHAALAAAFTATRELWPLRPRPAETIMSRGLEATERVLSANEGHAPLRAIARLRVHDAVRAVLRAALADEVWDFEAAEQSFGMRAKAWPALVLSGEPPIALRGSIDRVDLAHDRTGARVIDYKRTESTVKGAGSGLGETAIQVPLYACVASRVLGVPATGRYLAAQARDVDAKPSSKVQARMDELVARAGGEPLAPIEVHARDLVLRVRSGDFAPLPPDPSVCTTCAASGGCRKPRFAMAAAEEAEDRDRPA